MCFATRITLNSAHAAFPRSIRHPLPRPRDIEHDHVLQIEGVTFGYDAANPLFSNVHFGVDLDSRIGIVGPNGAGKSTLLNLILDKLRPLRGEVRRNPNLRIAHFTQHAAEQFDYRLNSVDNMIKLFPGVQEQVGKRERSIDRGVTRRVRETK